jgi:hypothetical protein
MIRNQLLRTYVLHTLFGAPWCAQGMQRLQNGSIVVFILEPDCFNNYPAMLKGG